MIAARLDQFEQAHSRIGEIADLEASLNSEVSTAISSFRLQKDQMAARMEEVGPKIQPIPKAGMPEDIARAALYLACDDSLFVTGTHIVVDGGLTIGGRGSWDPNAGSPILDALGITPEQAEQMRTAMAAQQKT